MFTAYSIFTTIQKVRKETYFGTSLFIDHHKCIICLCMLVGNEDYYQWSSDRSLELSSKLVGWKLTFRYLYIFLFRSTMKLRSQCCFQHWNLFNKSCRQVSQMLFVVFLLVVSLGVIESRFLVKTLPGFVGDLPFTLETG